MTTLKPRCGRQLRLYAGRTGTCGRPEGHNGQCASAASLRRKLNAAYRASAVRTHGYSGYSNGCRCRVCTDAKAAYMARRRAGAYVTDSSPETDPDVTHGTRFAYEERGCRCDACIAAQPVSSRHAGRRAA